MKLHLNLAFTAQRRRRRGMDIRDFLKRVTVTEVNDRVLTMT